MLDTTISIKTDNFDGPLGLLLLLIQKEEIPITKLDLTKITKQYLDYLAQMKELNFDIAGDYLYMAATLILLKSKACLYDDDCVQEDDNLSSIQITSQAELIRRLEELKRFQQLGQQLWKLPKLGHDIFKHPKIDRKTITNSILTPLELDLLIKAYLELLSKNKRGISIIAKDKISIKDKIIFFKSFLIKGQTVNFIDIVEASTPPSAYSKDSNDIKELVSNVIVTFISLLELARLNRISLFQNSDRGEIYIKVLTDLTNFNMNLADGFESDSDLDSDFKLKSEFKSKNKKENLTKTNLINIDVSNNYAQ